jgi:hypothetical protein
MIKSLNLEAINGRVLIVSSLLGKRSVFVNGSLTASTKSRMWRRAEFADRVGDAGVASARQKYLIARILRDIIDIIQNPYTEFTKPNSDYACGL